MSILQKGIGGSNPPVSASFSKKIWFFIWRLDASRHFCCRIASLLEGIGGAQPALSIIFALTLRCLSALVARSVHSQMLPSSSHAFSQLSVPRDIILPLFDALN